MMNAVTRKPHEVRAYAVAQAKEHARERGLSFAVALQNFWDANPQLKQRAYALDARPAATPEEDGHYLVRRFTKAGMTQGEAEKELERTHPATFKAYTFSITPTAGETLADRMAEIVKTYRVRPHIAWIVALAEDPTLREAVAAIPAASLARTEAERRHFARLVNANPARSYATNQPQNPWHRVLPKLTRDELVRLVAAGKLADGDIVEWVTATVMGGRKPVGLSPGLSGESQAWDDRLAAEVRSIADAAQLLKIREGGRSA